MGNRPRLRVRAGREVPRRVLRVLTKGVLPDGGYDSEGPELLDKASAPPGETDRMEICAAGFAEENRRRQRASGQGPSRCSGTVFVILGMPDGCDEVSVAANEARSCRKEAGRLRMGELCVGHRVRGTFTHRPCDDGYNASPGSHHTPVAWLAGPRSGRLHGGRCLR